MVTKKKKDVHHNPEEVIESAINRSENFLFRNGKMLLTILAIIVIVVGGYFGYKYLLQGPRNDKAANMFFVAEQQFEAGDYTSALNGDGNNAGFLQVIDKYNSTPTGNIAKHYAALCYIELGELDTAMEYLQKYSAVKGIPAAVINAQNLGLQGDMLSQKGDYSSAVAKYEAAIKAGDNSYTSPIYLKKAGLVYEQLGNFDAAIKSYQKVSDLYPTSMEARDIEKFIGAAQQM